MGTRHVLWPDEYAGLVCRGSGYDLACVLFPEQAPAFYQGRGYRICDTVADYPPDYAYHLLVKAL